jgi:hypothetical protein
MQSWIATGLGFCLNHIEECRLALFAWLADEYPELNTAALLRSAHRERIEALARGVISGIFSPDEARASEDLPAVTGGHGAMPRTQQQVVPLSYGTDLKPPDPNKPAPAPAPDAPPEQQDNSEGQDNAREWPVDGLLDRIRAHAASASIH